MKRSFIGAMCAGLMVAGAAVALTPAIASAATLTGLEISTVDPTGAPHPSNSSDAVFGNKIQVRATAVDVSDGKTCALAVTDELSGKSVFKSTFALRAVGGVFVGTKTTSGLKPGGYVVETRCGTDGYRTSATITNAPALVISGLASCYQSDQGKFIRPNGLTLDNGTATKVRLSPSTDTVGSAPKGTVSKFSAKVYSTVPYTATLTCGGTASKPQRSFDFTGIFAPNTDLTLIAD